MIYIVPHILMFSVTVGCNAIAFEKKQNPPHIVFILADDLVSWCILYLNEKDRRHATSLSHV